MNVTIYHNPDCGTSRNSEGQVWCSPERHGTLTAVFKNQIDWLPLESGGVRPTQGRTLAVMQVCGGSQSFNAVMRCACSAAGCAW